MLFLHYRHLVIIDNFSSSTIRLAYIYIHTLLYIIIHTNIIIITMIIYNITVYKFSSLSVSFTNLLQT